MESLLRVLLGVVLLAAIIFGLSGCGGGLHVDKAPPPVQTVTVEKIITATCIKREDIPALPPKGPTRLSGYGPKDAAIATDYAAQLRVGFDKAIALLISCAG